MTLKESYQDLADIWRWAARAYAERASKASTMGSKKDGESPWSWDQAAIHASQRAARYARLAEAVK